MKKIIGDLFSVATVVAASLQTHAQGFIYDQQSTNKPVAVIGNGNADGLNIQTGPLLQSFIPSLPAIGFLQLEFWDIPNNGNNGATVYVNLWTGSTLTNTATFLGSTTPVYMPNGFNNSGLFIAEITNFFFSTPIVLTVGQTYYLQPAVQSGDNPWDVITIGNIYPNGQLYGETGGFFQPSTDLWFREGILGVPEPSTLALFGLSILAFAFKCRSKLNVIFLAGLLGLISAHAQTAVVQASSDSVVQATADEAGLARVSWDSLPRLGTYWIMVPGAHGQLQSLPFPMLPSEMNALPTYSVGGNIFIIDNTGGQLVPSNSKRLSSAQSTSVAQSQAETTASLIELLSTTNADYESFESYGFSSLLFTNGLWLEVLRTNRKGNLAC